VRLREELASALRGIAEVIVYASDTNFLLVRTPFDATAVFADLLGRGVLVKNVSEPGTLDRCLRITVGNTVENERCARSLREAMNRQRVRPAVASGRSTPAAPTDALPPRRRSRVRRA